MKNARQYKIDKSKLVNDLSLLTISNFDSEAVTLMLLVRAGSTSDIERFSGTAHFLEHMFFKGAGEYSTSLELAMAIELLGGMTNAFTSYEYTGYYLKVPVQNLNKAMELFSDIICRPKITQAELIKERGVILEEIRMYEDLPQERVKDMFNSKLFPQKPLGRNIAGTLQSIENIDENILTTFRQENYTPENMILVVSGDIDKKKVFELAQATFGTKLERVKTQVNKIKTQDTEIQRKVGEKYFHITRKTEQAHLVMGGFAMERNHQLEYPFKLGMTILADGFGSKLFQELREKQGIAYYLGGGVATFKDTGKYIIKAGISVDKLELGIGSIITAIREVLEGKFTTKDLLRAKNYYTASIIENIETGEDKAGWFGINTLLDHKILTPRERIAVIEDVSKDLLIKSWQEIISNNNLMIGVISKNKLDLSMSNAIVI